MKNMDYTLTELCDLLVPSDEDKDDAILEQILSSDNLNRAYLQVVAGIKFKDKDGIQIMKGYMAQGSFSLGKAEI